MLTGEIYSWDPHPAGEVLVIKHEGTTLYVGGGFTNIASKYDRDRLARFDATTGVIDDTWKPDVTSPGTARVRDLFINTDGVYVAGNWAQIHGAWFANVAKLSKIDASIDTVFAPKPDLIAYKVYAEGPRVFLAGSYATLDNA